MLINPETIKKNAYLPTKLSELSRVEPEAAIKLLQDWGDGKKPVIQLWDEVVEKLGKYATNVAQ